MENNNFNNQPVNTKSNTLVAVLLIILIVLVIGIFIYFKFINKDDNNKNNKEENNVVEPTSTPVPTASIAPTSSPTSKINETEIIVADENKTNANYTIEDKDNLKILKVNGNEINIDPALDAKLVAKIKDALIFKFTYPSDHIVYTAVVGKYYGDFHTRGDKYAKIVIDGDTIVIDSISITENTAICDANPDEEIVWREKFDYSNIVKINGYGVNIEETNKEVVMTAKDYKKANNVVCDDDNISVKNGEKKEIKVGETIRTIERKNYATYIDNKLFYRDQNGFGDVYVLSQKLILLDGIMKFYDANLNEINYILDSEEPSIEVSVYNGFGLSGYQEYQKTGKIIINGTNQLPYIGNLASINDKTYDICIDKDGQKVINPELLGKLSSAKYEGTYENNKLTFKRVKGTEKYYNDTKEWCSSY